MEVHFRYSKCMQKYTHVTHGFGPIYNQHSKILILGSFPSVLSREVNFYYGHPYNRFWPLMERIYEVSPLSSIEEKKEFLLHHQIALWDVIEECDIIGSSDSSIKNVIPTDVSSLLKKSSITRIYGNGTLANKLYQQYQFPHTHLPIIPLPSTSSANARMRLEDLYEIWKQIYSTE